MHIRANPCPLFFLEFQDQGQNSAVFPKRCEERLDVLQILGKVFEGGLQSRIDEIRMDLIVFVNDSVSQPGTGSYPLGNAFLAPFAFPLFNP